jgi:hypothetical protein
MSQLNWRKMLLWEGVGDALHEFELPEQHVLDPL